MAINQVGLLPARQFLANRGQYFRAQNPTTGTGVALAAQIQAFSATNGFFVGQNTSTNVNCYLDYLKLILTAATTAVVSVDIVTVLDTVTRAPTTGSTGTAMTAVNTNGASNTASVMSWTGYNVTGAMTIPAAGASARTVSRSHFATGLHVVGDVLRVQYGDTVGAGTGGLTGSTRTTASAPGAFEAAAPPVIVGPQQWVVVHRWSLTEAGAPSYEWELGWSEG